MLVPWLPRKVFRCVKQQEIAMMRVFRGIGFRDTRYVCHAWWIACFTPSTRLDSARLGSRGTFHARKVGKKRKGLFPFGRCRVTFAQRKRKLTVNRMLARFILNVRSLLQNLRNFVRRTGCFIHTRGYLLKYHFCYLQLFTRCNTHAYRSTKYRDLWNNPALSPERVPRSKDIMIFNIQEKCRTRNAEVNSSRSPSWSNDSRRSLHPPRSYPLSHGIHSESIRGYDDFARWSRERRKQARLFKLPAIIWNC